MAFDPLDLTDLGADVILTEATMLALYNNPQEIAKRGVSAPVVQIPVRQYITTVGAGVWNWPDGVTAAEFTAAGGGGGTSAGGASSVTYDAVTATANGGGFGNHTTTAGGTASGGDLNVQGSYGVSTGGGRALLVPSEGGRSVGSPPVGFGAGAVVTLPGATMIGAGAGSFKKRLVRVPGQDTVTYVVGAAGGGATPGIIIIEY